MLRSFKRFRSVFILFLCAVSLLQGHLSAQPSDAYAEVRNVSTVLLPGNEAVLSLRPDSLCVGVAGLVLRADYHNGEVLSLKADVYKNRLDKCVSYVTWHPVTGNLFYTSLNRRGRSSLYEVVQREGKSPKIRRVKVGGQKYGVLHPVFSTDGRLMVFAARVSEDTTLDLWYSWQTEKGWTDPVPMGEKVNTPGDEASPFICGNYLFFASKGRSASDPMVWRIYAARIAPAAVADSLVPPSLTVTEVQPLPDGVNSGQGDMELVVDTVHHTLHWVSLRNGSPALCTFAGTPEGFVLSGQVTEVTGRPMAGVRVEAWFSDRCLASVLTDAQGRYSLPLQAGREYQLQYSRLGYFTHRLRFCETHSHRELLQPVRRDVTLNGWSIDAPLYVDNLFGDNADVVLTAEAEQQLQQVVRFLADNLRVQATLTLHCARTNDAYVNSQLNERRLAVLQAFVSDKAPSVVAHYEASGNDGRQDALGNRLSDWLEVTFRKK